ncbi:MAG: retropepsin-like aspartic protease [Planctomycetota bacterium]
MIPLIRRGNLFAVEAQALGDVEQGMLLLALDTGATRTVFDFNVAKRLKLQPSKRRSRMVGIDGPVGMPTASIDRLVVDHRSIDNMEVAFTDLPIEFLCDGLLGLDFLGSGTATFDFDRATLALA